MAGFFSRLRRKADVAGSASDAREQAAPADRTAGGAARDATPSTSASAISAADTLIASGHAHEDRGEFEPALALYRQATIAAPAYARAWMNVGNALRQLERFAEAIDALRHAIAQQPEYAPARFNLGALLADRGDGEGAEHELREAIRIDPRMIEPSIVLADLYETQSRFDDAKAQFERALAIAPDHAGTMLNLGVFYFRQGRVDDAVAAFRRAKAIDPGLNDAESSLLFAMNFRDDLSPEAIAEEHRRVGAAIARAVGPPIASWANVPDAGRRLAVGYVSGDYTHHPVTLFLKPVLDHHDRSKCKVTCYSNHATMHPAAEALRARADRWRNISALDDAQVVELIRRDGIDILVDLSGHTNRNRLPVFARHPAPVQVTWLGYLNTTGIPAIAYRIVDAHTDPEGATETLHSEQLVRMPDSQWCYIPWYDVARVPHPHADRPDAVVFGSFNQYMKIGNACLDRWCEILRRVPAAELSILDIRSEAIRQDLLSRIEARGIPPSRVSIRGRQDILEYFTTIGNVDIALDTAPYNGATTTLDALWMDVPIVGLRGDRGISRGTYSILSTLGAQELIARSSDEYVDINVRLANEREWREKLRQTLRPRLERSPLMDAQRFTAALEDRYRAMWRAWCAEQRG
jgi:protein O-GlcNAc transferase